MKFNLEVELTEDKDGRFNAYMKTVLPVINNGENEDMRFSISYILPVLNQEDGRILNPIFKRNLHSMAEAIFDRIDIENVRYVKDVPVAKAKKE